MYQTLLVRAAALVLCDNLGIERPAPPSPGDDGLAAEREAVASILGRDPASLPGGAAIDAALREASSSEAPLADDRRADLARFFAKRMHRLAGTRKALLGPLFERLPQPLVAR